MSLITFGVENRGSLVPVRTSEPGSGPLGAAYESLRRVARGLLRMQGWGERSLEATGLAHEALVRLLGDPRVRNHSDRAYVFAAAVRSMRRVLIERARTRKRLKRGGGRIRLPLDEVADRLVDRLEDQEVDPEALDRALEKLARWSPRQAEAISLRFFVGLKVAAIAEQLGCSTSTVENELFLARAWLRRELGRLASDR